MKPRLISVVGPTASGKSELAVRLCQRLEGEVVSADSVQIYRRFDIGSAKPTESERAGVQHHLIDAFDPLEPVDAARFVQLGRSQIADILARGKTPVLCGGTFLWVRALIYGLAGAPAADEAIRARHRSEAEQFGRPWLHARLREVDPESHARLGPNDLVRVSRALEVYELTGKTLSALQASHGFREADYHVRFVGIRHPPAELAARIERRVLGMFERGWLDEVRGLIADGYGEARALRSVGYRQLGEALSGETRSPRRVSPHVEEEPSAECPIGPGSTRPSPAQRGCGEPGTNLGHEGLAAGSVDLPELTLQVVRATRIFVRRQLTWLRDEPVTWLEPGALDAFDPNIGSDEAAHE